MFAAIPFYDRSQAGTGRKLSSGNNDMFFLNRTSMPAPAPVPDPNSKGTGPLVSLGEYTVASQLADSRAPSPRPAGNVEESYDDPVKLGILPEDAVIGLFFSFHTVLNPVIALLDPTLHTPIYVRRRSKVLYTAILAAACRFFKTSHYKPVHDLAQLLLGRALADGVSSVEYIQALSIMIYWKEADDGSMWRKLGLAIRMAFELNMHHLKNEPMPLDELQARERLNEERTWFQLICHDWTMALQRGKPRMIPEEHFPREGLRWLENHTKFPCNADVMIVTSLEMVSHYSLFQAIRSSVTPQNRIQMEPFIRHVIGGGERFLNLWPLETLDRNLPPVSLSFLRFYQMRMRLALSELKLVLAYNPLPGASHILMLDCVNAALAILRHIIADFAPNGYLAYGQDLIPFVTAYAGTWLFKQLARFDEQLRETTLETFRALSNACRIQTQITGGNSLYYSKFFDHLLKHVPAPNTNGATTQIPSPVVAAPSGTADIDMSVMLPQLPPLEDMDTTWFFAVDSLKHWGQDFNYNAQFV